MRRSGDTSTDPLALQGRHQPYRSYPIIQKKPSLRAELGDYRESHRDPSKPAEYDPQFHETGTTLNLFWAIERLILGDIIGSMKPTPRRALDFACGTGRILAWLAGTVPETVGIDVSAPMLELARRRAPDSEVVEGDLTVDSGLVRGPFDIVTAFRFFLNAQSALRVEALHALRALLGPHGLLVTNFHLNPSSLTGLYLRSMKWVRGVSDAQVMMTVEEACNLLRQNGFEPVVVHGYGYLLHRTARLPFPWLVGPIERRLAKWNLMPAAALNFIVVSRPSSARDR